MKAKFYLTLVLLIVAELSVAQPSPERFAFKFLDSSSKIIYPALKVIKTAVYSYKSWNRIADKATQFELRSDTAELLSLKDERYAIYADSTEYNIISPHRNFPYEIKIIANYHQKVMTNIFIDPQTSTKYRSIIPIQFSEGNFLYITMDIPGKLKLKNGIEPAFSRPEFSEDYAGKISGDCHLVNNGSVNSLAKNVYDPVKNSIFFEISELDDHVKKFNNQNGYVVFSSSGYFPAGCGIVYDDGITKILLFANADKPAIEKYFSKRTRK